MQRSDDSMFWQSVTGSLLEDEEPQAGALRELFEETGLNENHGELVDCKQKSWFTIYPERLHRYAPGVSQNLEHVFLFKLYEKVSITLSDEHSDFKWLPKREAVAKMRSPSNQQAVLEHTVE